MKSKLLISLIFSLIISAYSFVAHAQAANQATSIIVQGTVSSVKEGPLIGVSISEVDATNRVVGGTTTDLNGYYVLRMKSAGNKINYSYTGFISQSRRTDGSKKIDIVLVENTQQLKEVMITSSRRTSENGFSIPKREIATAIQSLDMKEVEGLQVSSIDEALQGRIAGLDIVANSGDAGSGSSMRIRGASSINGSSTPLIVLNDVPYEMQVDNNFDFANSNQEQFANLLSINPDDIQEITVLKDAAASAIWGSKGANGVISIKTKKGYSGPTKIEYSYRFTGTVQPRGLKMLTGDDYTMLMKQAYFNVAQDQSVGNFNEYNYNTSFTEYNNYNKNTDWVKAVTQIGSIHDHYLTLSGGGERATYRVSGGILDQRGTIIGQQYSRLSSRSYLEYKVSDRMKFISELSFTYAKNAMNYNYDFRSGNTPGVGDTPNEDMSILGIAYKKMPNLSIYKYTSTNERTNEFYNILPTSQIAWDQKYLANPVQLALGAKNLNSNYRILPTFRLMYDFLDPNEQKLRYNMYVSFDINNDNVKKFLPGEVANQSWTSYMYNNSGSSDSESLTIQTDNNLQWEPKFDNKDHYLLLYTSVQTTNGRSTYQGISSYNQTSVIANDPSNPAYLLGVNTGRGQWRSMGLLARFHYSYKGRYIASGTIRRDGSTKFGNGYKWGNFPGVSLKWIVSDEPFMKPTKSWLSMLALRPGWGIAGNQPSYEYLHFMRYGDYGRYIDMPSQVPTTIQLKNLRWETSTSTNYGADIGLFDDMIQIDMNLYHKRTKDLLFKNVKLPNSSGFPDISYINAGTMDNDGWEVNFYANKFVKTKNFSIDFRFNISNSINKIVKLEPNILSGFNGTYDYENGSYLTRIQEGNSYGSIYGFRYKGVYQYDKYIPGIQEDAPVARDANDNVIVDEKGDPVNLVYGYGTLATAYKFRGGDAKYEDVNHDGNINELDIVYLGNSNPLFNGGFGPTFRYKTFSCTVFFNYRVGNKIVNAARMHAENMYTTDNQSIAVNWRWRKDGDVTEIPRALMDYNGNGGYNWLGSDRFVEDGSFLRLKYLTFNYSLEKKVAQKLRLDRLNFYLTLNNLFVLSKYTGVDPEVGYGSFGVSKDYGRTPRTKDMTLGVTIGL